MDLTPPPNRDQFANASESDHETAASRAEDDPANYPAIIKKIQEREKELTRKTELLEQMVQTFSLFFNRASPGTPPSESQPSGFSPGRNFELPPYTTPGRSSTFPLSQASTPMYPKSYIRDALELISKYDGHNIPVWQFARACKRARDSIPFVDEAHLVHLIRNKLTGHAYLAVEDETHYTIEKFLDSLKKTFGTGKSSNYYRGQLSINYKKPNEHILDYIGRVKDLKSAIIEGDQTVLKRQLVIDEIALIDSFALESFYEGLPREFRTELKAEGYAGLTDAFAKAIAINKRLEKDEFRAQNRNTRSCEGLPSPLPSTPPGVSILRRNTSSNQQQSQEPAPTVSEDIPRKICSYCKNFGHLLSECRKRMYHANNPNNYNSNSPFVNNSRNPNNSNYSNSRNNFNLGNNSVNTNNSYGHAPSGNSSEASPSGASRGLGTPRPAFPLEATPHPVPSTSSKPPQEMSPPLN